MANRATNKAINWFEIPVEDPERAKAFYETVLATELVPGPPDTEVRWIFPCSDPSVATAGGLTASGEFEPSSRGAVVYLNAGSDLRPALARVADAGGRVLTTRTLVTKAIGYYATFEDTEGNRIGLQSDE